MEYTIEVSELGKSYTRKISGSKRILKIRKNEHVLAVQNLEFKIRKGELVGYIGINGSGKSTTIKLLTGILYPDNGTSKILGMNAFENRKKIASEIGVMFGQKSHLLWDIPLINSFELLKQIYKITDSDYKDALDIADYYLDIRKLLEKPVRTMSLGERMRCEFAAITLHNPQILFLDEPTIGLDVITKNKITRMLKYLSSEKMCTVFITTHDLRDVEKLCNRVIVLNDGKIVMDDYIKNILSRIEEKYIYITLEDGVLFNCNEKSDSFKIVKQNGNDIVICVDLKKVKVERVLSDILQNNKISAIDIKSPDLEDLIIKLYEKSIVNEVTV